MKRRYFAPAMLMTAMAVWVSGCGGGGGGTNNPPPPTFTRAVVNIDWPARSRNVGAPSSALSLVVNIKKSRQDGTDYVWTINRDVTAAATTKRYLSPTPEVKIGSWDVTLNFYAQADGGGAVVATGGAHVAIAEDGTGIDAITLTGVIATVEVPNNQAVALNAKADLIFTTKDGASPPNIVAVTPGSATWAVTSGSANLQFVNGQANAIANGTATVTATVDGKTSPPATVLCGSTTGTLVVNAKTAGGTLIPNTTITISQGGTQIDQKVTTTGSQTFNNVPGGQIDIKANAAGYTDGTGTATIVLGGSVTSNITLTPSSGTLVVNSKNASGALIPNSTITISQGGTQLDQKVTTTGSQTFSTPGGQIDIKVTAAGYLDGAASATVTLGSTTTKDVVLTATTGTLIVNAKGPNGALVPNATIDIYQAGTKLDEKITQTGSATFLKVPTGQIDIKIAVAGYQPGAGTATMTAGGTVTANVTMGKYAILVVNVKDSTGALIPGAVITLFQGGVQIAQQTAGTGSQTFSTLPPGATTINTTAGGFKPGTPVTVTVIAGQTVTANVSLVAQGKPQASTSPTTQLSLNGSTDTFSMDVRVVDGDGNPIFGLANSAFTIDPVVSGAISYTFALQSSTPTHVDSPGGYSAFLAVDASTSVASSDPNRSHIEAVKTFFSKMGGLDFTAYGYFPASNAQTLVSWPPQTPYIGFVDYSHASSYYPMIDGLPRTGYSGSPLWTAGTLAVDYTNNLARTANRAVVMFTDGKSTESTAKRTAFINDAKSKGIKVFMIGLAASSDPNQNPNTAELSLIAQSTGGSVMYATDAAQLVSFYGNLGQLLAGAGDFYRQTWTMTKSPGNLNVAETVPGVLKVTLADSTVLQAPFTVIIH